MIRRKSILLLFLALCSVHVQAQESQLDSLINVLSNSKDTTKVNTLNALGNLVNRSDPDEAIRYGNEARDLAMVLDFQKGHAYALKNIGLGYFMQSDFVEASINWEQSLKIFESIEDEAGIANMIGNLGAAYSYMGDDAKAVDFFLRSLKISEEKGDSIRMATSLLNIGTLYAFKPETVDKSLPYYIQALAISESTNYLDGIGTA